MRSHQNVPTASLATRLALVSLGVLLIPLATSCRRDAERAREREVMPSVLTESARDAQVSVTSAEQRSSTFERERGALAMEKPSGQLEVVARFTGPMPTGVTVSPGGRVFVSIPRWGDRVDATVVELREGQALPFPDAEINRWPATSGEVGAASRALVSVQSVVVDPKERLWLVDTGAPMMKETIDGGPKLMAIELATNRITETIPIPASVALRTSYLNDIRFDLRRGAAGYAFITDSSTNGRNGIIVVDLATKRATRRLDDHPSTKADKTFTPFVEGAQLRVWEPGSAPKPFAVGADGIAISADGARLYYCPLASRRLYSVSVDALVDPSKDDAAVAATVRDHGEKGASDGLESDAQGRIYVTDYEHNAIKRTRGDGIFETLVSDPRALWPDTLSIAQDGHLYFVANQLHRQARFNNGEDKRVRPFVLFRTKIDGTPVALAKP